MIKGVQFHNNISIHSGDIYKVKKQTRRQTDRQTEKRTRTSRLLILYCLMSPAPIEDSK